jgi:chemotaxis protein MotB
MKILDQIADHLKTVTDKHIRVEGHADNVEIGPSLKTKYPTNWELSKARASFVVRYLIEKGGIDSAQLSAVGYGDTKPVASNATKEGRQKNRRVEIILYSSEPSQNEPVRAPEQSSAGEAGHSFSRLGASSPVSDTPDAPPQPSSLAPADPATPPPGQAAPVEEVSGSDVTVLPTPDAPAPHPSDPALSRP